MEPNRNNSGLGTSGAGYNPGRDSGPDVGRDQAHADAGPGRDASGREPGRINKEAIKSSAKNIAREGRVVARDIGQDVKQQAREVAQELQGVAGEYVSQGRERLTSQVGCISRALHNAADEMGQAQGGEKVGNLAHTLASRIDEAVDFVQHKEPREIIRGIENFARREPALFLGGAVLIGAIAARFIKASSHRHGDDREFDNWRSGRGPYDREQFGEHLNIPMGAAGPMDERTPRGPLDNSGLGMGASPVDVTPRPPDQPPFSGGTSGGYGSGNFGGGV